MQKLEDKLHKCDYLNNHIPRELLRYEKDRMGPRWKGKGAEAKALADPMSKIVLKLQSSLIQSDARGILCGSSVLLAAEEEQALLFGRAYFGHPIVNADKDRQWFQLGMEEAFFLCYSLKCLKIAGEDKRPKDDQELWQCMKSKKAGFPVFYKAYSHQGFRHFSPTTS